LFTETPRKAAHLDWGNIPVLIGQKAGWAQDIVNTPENKDARPSAINLRFSSLPTRRPVTEHLSCPDCYVAHF